VRIERDPDFAADVRRQIAHAIQEGGVPWVVRLQEDLAEVERILAEFPQAGRELRLGRRATVRKLRLRRAPFVVWYQIGSRGKTLVLVRLFHVRQRVPD